VDYNRAAADVEADSAQPENMKPDAARFVRRTLALSLYVLAAVLGLSVLVGFVGSEQGFGWELAAVFGTALGTTLLAVTTGLLALLTWRDVSAAQELAQLARDEANRTQTSLGLPVGRPTRLAQPWTPRHSRSSSCGDMTYR
jgi:hypothetical protein